VGLFLGGEEGGGLLLEGFCASKMVWLIFGRDFSSKHEEFLRF